MNNTSDHFPASTTLSQPPPMTGIDRITAPMTATAALVGARVQKRREPVCKVYEYPTVSRYAAGLKRR
jgi:hypothetical protein